MTEASGVEEFYVRRISFPGIYQGIPLSCLCLVEKQLQTRLAVKRPQSER